MNDQIWQREFMTIGPVKVFEANDSNAMHHFMRIISIIVLAMKSNQQRASQLSSAWQPRARGDGCDIEGRATSVASSVHAIYFPHENSLQLLSVSYMITDLKTYAMVNYNNVK